VHAVVALALVLWTGWQCLGPAPADGLSAGTYDQLQQRRLWASAPDPRLLVIDIDERSLADMAGEFGRWPWPRDTLATVLQHAQAQGAAAVVFDVLFSDPDRLHPGGDAALSAAVAQGAGFFPVMRLQPALDARSELRVDQLPGLALPPATASAPAPRLAAVLPFMQTMLASGRLGTHTATLDSDGKVRRFAFHEHLAGGWQLRSMPAAVAAHLGVAPLGSGEPRLIVWRRQAETYPRVPFAVAFACAEGAQRADCPALKGKVVVIGATAAALHDIKTSPLVLQHSGVDMLATLIDNALHRRELRELPGAARWVACLLALGLAWQVVRRGRAGASGRALWLLPSALMALAWASLHSESLYLDLALPAGAALTFLSAVATLDGWRRKHHGLQPGSATGPWALACGGPGQQGERLERAVFDLAAQQGWRVSGGALAAGDAGPAQVQWTLWGLPDAASADRAAESLRHACEAATASFTRSTGPTGSAIADKAGSATHTWHQAFEPGLQPQAALALACGQALANTALPAATTAPSAATTGTTPTPAAHGRG
jgi:CHASE2 domain-containing sensor protein